MVASTSPEAHIKRFEHAARVIGALDSEQRLQIILRLAKRDHVVHELVDYLGKSQPLVSQHLRVLKRSGLVSSTRLGREVVYHLNIAKTSHLIEMAAEIGAEAAQYHDELAPRRRQPKKVAAVGDASATGGKAAVAGQAGDKSLDMPGLVPDTPTPPTPGIH